MKIALAQINPTVGALSGNSQKIIEIINENSSKCDLIIFPEMCLPGYPPQDLLLDPNFIQHIRNESKGAKIKYKANLELKPLQDSTNISIKN